VPRRTKKVSTREKLIGSRIAEIRKRRAMPQGELAATLGMSQSLLSRYERGLLRLHGALVVDLAKALRVSTDELLGTKDLKTNGHHDRRFVRRLDRIETLPKHKKQARLSTIDSFLKGEARTQG
jgi:transcriptional regulator with XRE-family HTH domain